MSRISDLAGFTTALSTTQDLSVGVITATSFSGDGSGLTGVASTDNIQTATDAKFLANVNITGITTATGGFVGDLTGNVTGNTSGTAGGLTGTPNITVGSVTAASGSFSGNVTIGGTLTYQDVTNIDSIGIITAQQGIQVLANGVDVTGIGTFEDRLTYDGSLGQAGGGTVTYTVTVASKDSTHRYNGQGSGNAYIIDNLQAPVLTLTPGRTYRFTNDNTGSHPLKFYYDANKTTLYTTGVTFDNAYTEITVTDTTPAVLHYQCTSHSLMGNSVITQSNPIVGAGITLNALGGGVHVTGIVTATTVKVGTAVSITDGAVSATTYHGDGGNLTNVGGVWVLIDKQTVTSSVGYGVTVSLGANLGVTTSYSQFKVWYDVWLNSGSSMRMRTGYGFGGNHPKDNIKSDGYYYYSGSYNRAGDPALQTWRGENVGYAMISANNAKTHHWGEIIFFNSAGRIPTNGSAGWPSMSYRCAGYMGGDTDSINYNVAGHYDDGAQNPLSCFQIYASENIVAGEVRTYGLTA